MSDDAARNPVVGAPWATGDGTVTVRLDNVPVTLSVRQLAACLAELRSDEQAEFFVELARLFRGFTGILGGHGQAIRIGEALASTGDEDAVELLSLVLEYASKSIVEKVMEA